MAVPLLALTVALEPEEQHVFVKSVEAPRRDGGLWRGGGHRWAPPPGCRPAAGRAAAGSPAAAPASAPLHTSMTNGWVWADWSGRDKQSHLQPCCQLGPRVVSMSRVPFMSHQGWFGAGAGALEDSSRAHKLHSRQFGRPAHRKRSWDLQRLHRDPLLHPRPRARPCR